MIINKKGNLFESEAPILAHGCNTVGKMGAGIARQFKAKYYHMYKEYQVLCAEGKFIPGKGFIYKTEDDRYIFNLATQGSLSGARLEYIESAFLWMKAEMEKMGIYYAAMPKIGGGLGRLDWDNEIFPILSEHFTAGPMTIEVWEYK